MDMGEKQKEQLGHVGCSIRKSSTCWTSVHGRDRDGMYFSLLPTRRLVLLGVLLKKYPSVTPPIQLLDGGEEVESNRRRQRAHCWMRSETVISGSIWGAIAFPPFSTPPRKKLSKTAYLQPQRTPPPWRRKEPIGGNCLACSANCCVSKNAFGFCTDRKTFILSSAGIPCKQSQVLGHRERYMFYCDS